MVTKRSVCPLNCPDCCSFLVEILGDRIKVHGDMQTMGVSGFVCPKGRDLGDLVYSPDRLRYPLLKTEGDWQKISWDEAYQIITEKIEETVTKVGSQAILHLFDSGHNGRLRELDRRFFQALGGVTEPRGSMCWGAGIGAQKKDFGAVYSSDWEEMLHSKTIILWGRDPAVTNKHLIPLLRQAAERGTHIVVINPLRVKSTAFAQEYIKVNPGTDGILALGISYFVLRERWMDFDFVKDYALNFGSYAALIKEYPPERASAVTGVPVEIMESLAKRITHERPVMFYLGYGLQRYVNGGNTVRAIDALATISGNIGCQGGGVFYAHQYHRENLNSVLLPEDKCKTRTFPHATMAYELLKPEILPKINLAFVTRSNPLVTEPDSLKWRELWDTIPFKVVFERRMSQTAALSDLVLPIATIFEEEDLVATSWSTRLHYAPQILKPQGEVKSEPLIFTELAEKLGLKDYFPYTSTEWLEYIIEPLDKYGITLAELKKGPLEAPYIPKVAWEDKKFATPSGKIELVTKEEFFGGSAGPVERYFEKLALASYLQHSAKEKSPARQDENHSAKTQAQNTAKIIYLDNYKSASKNRESLTTEYPYILMTPHPDMALHTQFQADEGFSAYLHPETASVHGIVNGDKIVVESETGELRVVAYISDNVHEQTVVIPEGTTDDKHLGVNCLIPGRLSGIGENTAYYDNFCRIRLTNQE
jgi:anaerobic selenocysteine-containing dehydrogenase